VDDKGDIHYRSLGVTLTTLAEMEAEYGEGICEEIS
jgi:hypothetical protein